MVNLKSELSDIGAAFWMSLPAHKREEYKDEKIELGGHTDNVGSAAKKLK